MLLNLPGLVSIRWRRARVLACMCAGRCAGAAAAAALAGSSMRSLWQHSVCEMQVQERRLRVRWPPGHSGAGLLTEPCPVAQCEQSRALQRPSRGLQAIALLPPTSGRAWRPCTPATCTPRQLQGASSGLSRLPTCPGRSTGSLWLEHCLVVVGNSRMPISLQAAEMPIGSARPSATCTCGDSCQYGSGIHR